VALIPTPPFADIPLFMQAVAGDPEIDYSAADFGRILQSVWRTPGVIGSTDFHVQQADTPGWAIKILPGRAMIGRYLVTLDTAITIDVSALNTSPAATRFHRVYLAVSDKVSGDTEYSARIKVAEDFGAGANPPVNASVFLLATFTISPGQSNIQNAQIAAVPGNASYAEDLINLFTAGYLASGVVSAYVDINSPPRARYGMGRVQLSGGVMQSGGARFTAASTVIGTLPYNLRPYYTVWCPAACSDDLGTGSGSLYYRLNIAPSGVMTADLPTGVTPKYLMLDGISYEVD
jgi:hypothetical protein